MNKLIKSIIAGVFLISATYHGYCQHNGNYTADWASLGEHKPVPEWIRDAMFGIYCHWGVHSVPAYDNEQYYFYMHQDSAYDKMGTYRRQGAIYGPLSKFGYHGLYSHV